MLQTVAQLQAATGCTKARAELFFPFLQGAMKAYEITTPKRVAGFLSQIAHESGHLAKLEESLNYSVQGLQQFVRWGRISEADAQRFGRSIHRPADQQAIANLIYGGEWGKKNLGNFMWGDGWRFRGRGLKQLTGRSNYDRCGKAIGEDLLNRPERLLEPVNAALSAGWFWQTHGLNEIADRGDVPKMTRVINGGELGLAERTALFNKAVEVLA
jgi:putative chitinase